jgi:hypothetical protein
LATSTGSTFDALLFTFSTVFTEPSFANFVTLVTGWIRCTGRHTITGAIRYGMGAAHGKHFSTLYRFLSRAVWDPDELGQGLLRRLLPLAGSGRIHLIVDDTLCRRRSTTLSVHRRLKFRCRRAVTNKCAHERRYEPLIVYAVDTNETTVRESIEIDRGAIPKISKWSSSCKWGHD